ncbi:MAG: hypothetical protein DHS20C20_18810 [Ardenticatenaceae bacterium]|nr:MAG: hypothetical protein DHS20C20_18810 [Ardenticatenaceae bacterium]
MESQFEESAIQDKNALLEYEIVRLQYKYSFWKKRWVLTTEYLSIIEDYVNRGWNLLQLHQSNTKNLFGYPEFLEIIFTRPITENNPQKRRVRYSA